MKIDRHVIIMISLAVKESWKKRKKNVYKVKDESMIERRDETEEGKVKIMKHIKQE